MQADTGKRIRELRVDGGATVNNMLMQFQSDLLRAKVVRPRITETTARGAAFLAGLAVGFWPDREALSKLWKTDRIFSPDESAATMRGYHRQWEKAVTRSRDWE